jgi:uncharacterized protein with ACT and thioredoxin-like domain
MLGPEIIAAESTRAVERESYQSRSSSTDLGIGQPQSSRSFQQLFSRRSDQIGGGPRGLSVVQQTGDEYNRRSERVGIDSVSRSELEEFLGADLGEKR